MEEATVKAITVIAIRNEITEEVSSGIVTEESRIARRSSGVTSKDKERYWKRILIIDDDPDITTTFNFGIENANKTNSKRISVHTYNDPRIGLLEFKSNLYDLLLIDIKGT